MKQTKPSRWIERGNEVEKEALDAPTYQATDEDLPEYFFLLDDSEIFWDSEFRKMIGPES